MRSTNQGAPLVLPQEAEKTPISSICEVRRMSASSPLRELREAARMLAHAFDESPLFRLAFPRTVSRNKTLQTLFATLVEDSVRYGRVEAVYAGKIVGMLIWYPPGGYPMSFPRILRFLPQHAYIAAFHPLGILKLYRAQKTLDRLRPKQPHCHGYFLGGRQGERIGRILIKRVLQEVDENEWPIYLETQEPRAAKLYARFGFRMLHEAIETLPGGPLTWTMWREPHAAARLVA